VDIRGNAVDVSQLHFYTYNQSFLDSLPKVLQGKGSRHVRTALLKRLSVALGYLPSWASPQFTLVAHEPRDVGSLPDLVVRPSEHSFVRSPFLLQVLRRVCAVAPRLDLWPILPSLRFSAQGKSYHWGSMFPHAKRHEWPWTTDRLGRIDRWSRIHLIDASVFPNVPATTFTLTIMANAHRIVSETLSSSEI
jgi:hypothetical protein